MWDRRARILRVKDGDTIRVELDQGFGDTKTLDLRLLQTWAPESREAGGADTRAFVEQWIADRSAGSWPFVVTTVRVRSDEHEITTLGRYVGILDTASGESLADAVNAYVTAKGYGRGIGG